jgi:hypothetical protein
MTQKYHQRFFPASDDRDVETGVLRFTEQGPIKMAKNIGDYVKNING